MAAFYVLPPRAQVGLHFQEFLASVFPGLSWPREDWPDLAEALAQAGQSQPGVYVVFRDDFDETLTPEQGLARDFGAEQGDEIIIVRPHRNPPVVEVERKQLGDHARAA